MSQRVSIDVADHVATVLLDREAKRNAIDLQMFEELTRTAEALANDQSVRAVVLSAQGAHFCAGIDLASFAGGGLGAALESRMDACDGSPANFFQSAAYAWRTLPVPVIAALRGVTFGGGFQIAMGADIRYAAPDMQMSIMEIKWGIIPDMAISTTLRHIAATDKVKELAFTGRIVEATEARDLDLVTAIKDDPLAAAKETAADIAAKSPEAIRAIKILINDAWNQDEAAALRTEARLQLKAMASVNQREAVSANLENRPARFADPDS